MKKVALVTGASAGIGMETAKFLANHDYIVYGAARRTASCRDENEEISEKLYAASIDDSVMM